MGLVRIFICGVIGAVIGALVWAGIAYTTGYEIGWIAWGLGWLVGFLAALGATEDTPIVPAGVLAAALALAGIAGGKYLTVTWVIGDELTAAQSQIADSELRDWCVGEICEQVEQEMVSAGTLERVSTDDEPYADEAIAEATQRWEANTPAQQDALIAAKRQLLQELMNEEAGAVSSDAFKESFGVLDLVFGALAVFTAFKLSAGAAALRAAEAEVSRVRPSDRKKRVRAGESEAADQDESFTREG